MEQAGEGRDSGVRAEEKNRGGESCRWGPLGSGRKRRGVRSGGVGWWRPHALTGWQARGWAGTREQAECAGQAVGLQAEIASWVSLGFGFSWAWFGLG